MELKKIKTRYGGKCGKCGREIKKDWNVYFNPSATGEAKEIYCLPCGDAMQSGEEISDVTPEENLELIAKLDSIAFKLDNLAVKDNADVIKTLDTIINRLDDISDIVKKLPTKATKKS